MWRPGSGHLGSKQRGFHWVLSGRSRSQIIEWRGCCTRYCGKSIRVDPWFQRQRKRHETSKKHCIYTNNGLTTDIQLCVCNNDPTLNIKLQYYHFYILSCFLHIVKSHICHYVPVAAAASTSCRLIVSFTKFQWFLILLLYSGAFIQRQFFVRTSCFNAKESPDDN